MATYNARPATNGAPQAQPQAQSSTITHVPMNATSNVSADKMLLLLIVEHLKKRGFTNSVDVLCAESELSSNYQSFTSQFPNGLVPEEVRGDFLLDWWRVFWDSYLVRVSVGHAPMPNIPSSNRASSMSGENFQGTGPIHQRQLHPRTRASPLMSNGIEQYQASPNMASSHPITSSQDQRAVMASILASAGMAGRDLRTLSTDERRVLAGLIARYQAQGVLYIPQAGNGQSMQPMQQSTTRTPSSSNGQTASQNNSSIHMPTLGQQGNAAESSPKRSRQESPAMNSREMLYNNSMYNPTGQQAHSASMNPLQAQAYYAQQLAHAHVTQQMQQQMMASRNNQVPMMRSSMAGQVPIQMQMPGSMQQAPSPAQIQQFLQMQQHANQSSAMQSNSNGVINSNPNPNMGGTMRQSQQPIQQPPLRIRQQMTTNMPQQYQHNELYPSMSSQSLSTTGPQRSSPQSLHSQIPTPASQYPIESQQSMATKFRGKRASPSGSNGTTSIKSSSSAKSARISEPASIIHQEEQAEQHEQIEQRGFNYEDGNASYGLEHIATAGTPPPFDESFMANIFTQPFEGDVGEYEDMLGPALGSMLELEPSHMPIIERETLEAHEGKATACSFSDDGILVASGGQDLKVQIWKIGEGETKSTLWKTIENAHTQMITQVKFAYSQQRIATASFDKTIRIWDFEDDDSADENDNGALQPTFTLTGHTAAICAINFHPNADHQDLLCSSDTEGTLMTWSIHENEWKQLHSYTLTAIAGSGNVSQRPIRFQPFAPHALAVANGPNVEFYDCVGNRMFGSISASSISGNQPNSLKSITAINWHPMKPLMVIATTETITIWEIRLGPINFNSANTMQTKCLASYTVNGNKVSSCSFLADRFVIFGTYQQLCIWEFEESIAGNNNGSTSNGPGNGSMHSGNANGKMIAQTAHDGLISSISVSRTGALVASTSHDSSVKLWSVSLL